MDDGRQVMAKAQGCDFECSNKVEATFSLQEGWSYKRGATVLFDFL
jgi:hypothetical protein